MAFEVTRLWGGRKLHSVIDMTVFWAGPPSGPLGPSPTTTSCLYSPLFLAVFLFEPTACTP